MPQLIPLAISSSGSQLFNFAPSTQVTPVTRQRSSSIYSGRTLLLLSFSLKTRMKCSLPPARGAVIISRCNYVKICTHLLTTTKATPEKYVWQQDLQDTTRENLKLTSYVCHITWIAWLGWTFGAVLWLLRSRRWELVDIRDFLWRRIEDFHLWSRTMCRQLSGITVI